ncbi:arginine--tRNA ligase, partial [Candidatus Poribacteria bacterium]
MTEEVKAKVRESIERAVRKAISEGALQLDETPQVRLERPKDESLGDLACTLALELAGRLKRNPREIAEEIVARMDEAEGHIKSVEVAGPGFINIRLTDKWMADLLRRIHSEKENYGRWDIGKGVKVQVEFVSTNPTGPLNVVNGRAASVGDSLVNILEAVGYDVTREFYINDAGGQAYRLARSIEARYQQLLGNDVPFPE